MVRTQIYLTDEENSAIARLAVALGHGKSELIRQAIDEFVEKRDVTSRLRKLRAARGMWSDSDEVPDIAASRAAFDRF